MGKQKNIPIELEKTMMPLDSIPFINSNNLQYLLPKSAISIKNENEFEYRYDIEVVCPKLVQIIKESEHFKFVKDSNLGNITLYMYKNGYYQNVTENEFKGMIRKWIPELIQKSKDIDEIYKLLLMDDSFYVDNDYLNSDANCINFKNGILNLDTMTLSEHTPDKMFTIQIPINYIPLENCEKGLVFEKYLNELVDGDLEMRECLLEAMGLAMSNIPGYLTKKSILMIGPKDCGKTQIKKLLTHLIGVKYTSSIEISVVSANSFVILYGKDETGIVKAGEQFQFQIANSLCQNSELKWISSDSKTAVITDQGVVTLKKEGNVTITVYDPTNPSDDTKKINYVITIIGETEADYISRFIHMALRENGVHETGNNYQKYGEWYPNNGQPWCAMFVSWCWYHSGLSNDILCKYQGCYAGMKWCTEKGIMHFVQDYTFTEKLENNVSSEQKATNYQPATGDIVFFLSSGMSHTGIVIYSDDLYVYTIEGNTSDQVAIKRWSLNDARITGYAHPEYPPYSSEREDFSWIALPKDDGTNWWSIVDEQQKVD